MRATALLIVFLLCKLLVLAGRHVEVAPWAIAAIAPFLFKRMRVGVVITLSIIVFAGAFASNHIETDGKDRNPFTVLLTSAFARVTSRWATSMVSPLGLRKMTSRRMILTGW